MTSIHGGPIAPGDSGDYANESDTDRAITWWAAGGRQGALRGFTPAGVAGQMALDYAAGACLIAERNSSGAIALDRGYLAWADATTRVAFGPASPSARNDAVICCAVDTEEGPVGTGGLASGPHIVVVPGVSGVTTAVADSDITAFVGRGGWVRLHDVPIAPTDTQINMANLVSRHFRVNGWNGFSFTPASGWSFSVVQYARSGLNLIHVVLVGTYSGSTITADSAGNIGPDVQIGSNWPASLTPSDRPVYDRFVRNGVSLGSWRVSTAGDVHITDAYPNSTIASGSTCTFRATYFLGE